MPQFTNLNRKLERIDRGYKAPKKKRLSRKFLIRAFILLLIISVIIYLPVRGVYQSAKKIVASGRALSASAKNENLDEIRQHVRDMRKSTGELNGSLNWLIWMKIIPVAGGYYSDVKKFSKAAEYDLNAVQTIVDSLDPYKQELGFTGSPTPGQDRVSQFVKILDKVLPQLDKIEPDLEKASKEVAGIDTNKYPEKFGKYRLRSQVEAAKNLIQGVSYAVSEARPALEIAPSALGEPTAKNYLLIFQNDKELRATGGFMTAYAFMRLDKGRVSSSSSDDIYRLDEKLLQVCENKICPLAPPDQLVKYLPEGTGKPKTAWSMRDANTSPDVPTSMKQFEKFYDLVPGLEKFDGIILIDTHVVEELIKITGPIEVFGTKYSAEKDDRCNCPNVVYELENYAQIIEKGEQDRKAILGTMMQQLLARSLGASTDKLPEFINAGTKLAEGKHIIVYMHDPKTQSAMSQLNWTGEIKPFEGDYLHINDANYAGGKTNIYVRDDVTLDIKNDGDKLLHKLTIVYKNPQPYNTWLNGINRTYFRIYVPKGSELVNSKGSQAKMTTTEDELGKTMFDGFIQVRPQSSITVEMEYKTPNVAKGNNLPLMIQKQGGTENFDYTIKVDGKQKEKFPLSKDMILNLSL